VLLSFSAFARRAEYGSFKILVGSGIGSRIARLAAPILLVLPFLREAGRMRLLHDALLPQHYVSAILASSAAVLSFGLLLILAWRINGMEIEIQDLSLRDELTGLYNLRGFHLLAEQALHLAQRSQLPFSVLFIDLDNLKQINDEFGHKVGSEFLVETAALLRTIFRETDVVGRIGGDEFAVAGEFSRSAVSIAVQRIEEGAASAAPETGHRMPLNLSIGCVTNKEHVHESLHDLLAQADKAMYERKRSRKLQVR
jgi:diguanylate cyclase (GGDEF)-like protein